MLTLHTAHALLQEFLRCDYFIDTGAPGLLLRLRAATAACLQDVDFGGSATQQVWMQGLGLRLSSVSLLLFLAAGHVPPTLTPPPLPPFVHTYTHTFPQRTSHVAATTHACRRTWRPYLLTCTRHLTRHLLLVTTYGRLIYCLRGQHHSALGQASNAHRTTIPQMYTLHRNPS